MTKMPATLSLAALVLTAACEAGGGTAERTTFHDSAGIRIVENGTPDDSAAHTWWRIGESSIDIGGPDAVEPYALHRVSAGLRMPDGSIVVGSSVSADIRVFAASGEHIRTTGRKGAGPGEFQAISWMERITGDSILVFDTGNRRLTLLDPEGRFTRVLPVPQDGAPARVLGRFANGDLLVSRSGAFSMPDDGFPRNEVTSLPTHLGRFSTADLTTDSLGAFAGPERVIRVDAEPGGQIRSLEIIQPPFARTPSFAAGLHEFFVGAQEHPEIQVYDTTGTLRRIIRTGRASEPVTQAHLDARFRQQLEQMPERMRTEMRASGPPDLPHGEFVPPYGDLIVDRAGNLWAADYNDPLDPPGRWTIYDPQGAAIARIALPATFRPLDIGRDYILGRELDDLETEHIRVFPIIRQEPEAGN